MIYLIGGLNSDLLVGQSAASRYTDCATAAIQKKTRHNNIKMNKEVKMCKYTSIPTYASMA
jgi:hypothetical protein